MSVPARDLRDLDLPATQALVAELGEAPYRAQQLFRAVHGRGVRALDEITDVSRTLRARLSDAVTLGGVKLAERRPSGDGSEKLVFELADKKRIESVLIPERDEAGNLLPGGKLTQCISTQAGCPLACTFCLTGALGLARNLTTGEIVDQAHLGRQLAAQAGRRVTNLVYMGMGEPLLNYEAVVRSVAILTHDWGGALSHRRITISTAGVVPAIERYGTEPVRANLAVSLNASNDEVRDVVMPINRKWDIATLLGTLRRYPLEPRRRLTFEYVLLDGVNDSIDDAERTARLLRGFRCKVNIIPHNPHPASPYRRPGEARIAAFQQRLKDLGLSVYLRDNRGNDVLAACGQLGDLGAPFRPRKGASQPLEL